MKFRYLSFLLIFFLICVSAFGFFPQSYNQSIPVFIKNNQITNTEQILYAYPSGESCGMKLITNGVLVLSLSGVTDSEGRINSPGKDAGIIPGDFILKFNGTKVISTEHLESLISNNKSAPVTLELKRNNKVYSTTLFPVCDKNMNTFLGIWVRDSAAGLGTLTCYTEDKEKFAALGHSISDTETGELMSLKKGELISSEVLSVKKGYPGLPGELTGVFSSPEKSLGKITSNNEYGIYGNLSCKEAVSGIEAVPVAKRNEITTGPAQILTTVKGSKPEYFDIEIVKFLRKENEPGKNMIIKITDKKLLEQTGGIVQGMSGSPILQNGKLIGAVTHVFVNDPTRGYGIFIENMLSAAEKSK